VHYFQNLSDCISLFPYGFWAGILLSISCTLIGIFVILKRITFIGITLSQVSAFGIAAGLAFHINPFITAFCSALLTVIILSLPYESKSITRESIMGFIFVLSSALSILIVANSGFGLDKVKALLYGKLILTSKVDFIIISIFSTISIIFILLFLRPIVYCFMDRECSITLHLNPTLFEILYFACLGFLVASASKIAGSLLIFSYLILPSTLALCITRSIKSAMVAGSLFSVLATLIGFSYSFEKDLPTNQVIIVSLCFSGIVIYLITIVIKKIFKSLRN